MSASELWVAAQRAMPGWARGRMNATVIMISQGAMALGGVIWGSAGAIAGASYTLLGAAVLFLTSLLLARRLSINSAENLEERVEDDLAKIAEPEAVTSIALTNELLGETSRRIVAPDTPIPKDTKIVPGAPIAPENRSRTGQIILGWFYLA